MSDLLKGGGPAFPTMWKPYGEAPEPDHPGMSLRDYFAAQAIHLFPLCRPDVDYLQQGKMPPQHDLVAHFCYDLADAMLRRREQ